MAEPTGQATPTFFPELRQLERDAAVLAGRLKAAEAAAVEASAKDPSEQLRVTLGALGRVSSVEVDPGWRSRLGSGDLGAAVLAAYREAGSRRLETWAAEITRTDGRPGPDASSVLPDAEPAVVSGPGPSDESAHESIRRLWHLLQDATDRLDEVAREATARSRAVVAGRDPGGHVTASFTGGELTDLAVEAAWAERSDARLISTALTAAVVDGYAAVDQLAQQSAGQWPFPELERISGSPAALLATLGLPVSTPDDDRRRE